MAAPPLPCLETLPQNVMEGGGGGIPDPRMQTGPGRCTSTGEGGGVSRDLIKFPNVLREKSGIFFSVRGRAFSIGSGPRIDGGNIPRLH